jgi:hypothetical protein
MLIWLCWCNQVRRREDNWKWQSKYFSFAGFLQLIGCLGALRLSEKLLNAYWLLLLVLLIGDAILGIFWMFKFDRIMQELSPMLRLVVEHVFAIVKKFYHRCWHQIYFLCHMKWRRSKLKIILIWNLSRVREGLFWRGCNVKNCNGIFLKILRFLIFGPFKK